LLEATQKANCTKILEALQTGVNPNIRDPKGRTPLHFMSGVGLAPGVVLLIHFGADVEARDEDGLAPIHMAAGYANAQTLRVLVAAGADANVTATSQGTPLSVVLQLGEYQLKAFIEEKKGALQRFKKKDEKLEKLKACLEVLEDPQAVRDDSDWDAYLEASAWCCRVTCRRRRSSHGCDPLFHGSSCADRAVTRHHEFTAVTANLPGQRCYQRTRGHEVLRQCEAVHQARAACRIRGVHSKQPRGDT